MKILNAKRTVMVAERVQTAATFWQRFLGLRRFRQLPAGEGLYLADCNWIHTFGMSYAIDAIHLDEKKQIVACETLKPWRVGRWVRAGRDVLELPAGTCQRLGCQNGDQLKFF